MSQKEFIVDRGCNGFVVFIYNGYEDYRGKVGLVGGLGIVEMI